MVLLEHRDCQDNLVQTDSPECRDYLVIEAVTETQAHQDFQDKTEIQVEMGNLDSLEPQDNPDSQESVVSLVNKEDKDFKVLQAHKVSQEHLERLELPGKMVIQDLMEHQERQDYRELLVMMENLVFQGKMAVTVHQEREVQMANQVPPDRMVFQEEMGKMD